MNKEVLHTPMADFEIKDDILYVTYREKVKIDLEAAKKIVTARLEYAGNEAYPFLVFDDGVVSMDKAARDYLSEKDLGLKGVIAGALVLKSVYSEFLGNFYLRITKPAIPTKIFTDREKAIEWLEQYKPKSVVM